MKKIVSGIMLTLLLIVMLTFPFSIMPKTVATNGTTISIIPQNNIFNTKTTPVNSTFVVNATVTDVIDLWNWQINMTFDPTLLQCTDAIIPPDSPFYFAISPPPVIDNAAGYVCAGSSQVPTLPGKNGNGTLLTITLNITTAPSVGSVSCNLTLHDRGIEGSALKNHLMEDIPATLEDGNFTYVLPPPDVAVLNVTSSKTVVGQGYSATIKITVENQGDYTETFNITVYANTTVIGTQTVNNMLNGTSTVLTFTWKTTGFAKGNYTIWAYAWPVLGETDTLDNTLTNGIVKVAMPGDIVEPFGIVDMTDIGWICLAYGSYPSYPKWNPNADITNNGIVDMTDIGYACLNYGKQDP